MTTPPGGWPPAPPPPGPYGYVTPPDHPQAATVFVLGIVGLVVCQLLSPFALVMGRRTLAQIDASGGHLGGRGQAQAGYILGIVGTVLLGLGLALLLVYAVFVLAMIGGVAAG